MERPRVLVIASRNEETERLCRILEENAFEVVVAHERKEAVALAEEQMPEVVLLEFQNPRFDGPEFLYHLKKREAANVPIILLLDVFDEDDVAESVRMGAADYLVKPFVQDEVVRRTRVLARVCRQERRKRHDWTAYQEILNGEQQGLFLSTQDGRFLEVNEALVRLLGYESKEELMQIDIKNDLYWNPEDREHFQQLIENQGSVKNFKVDFKRKDGQKITILLSGQVVRDEKGAIVGYEGSNVDITEHTKPDEDVVAVPEKRETEVGIFQQFLSRLFPAGGHLFSLIKMTELIADRYEKLERLGVGSFGEVWKVRDLETQEGEEKYYVAKIPTDKKLNEKFRKEAAICERLKNYPNAVNFIKVVEHRGRAVLIQEYVEGSTLRELMDVAFDEIDRESLILQLTDMVAYAHRHRIVHRDIKPENIIIRKDGTVKLLDYGVAKELKDKDISSTMVGSRPYMAPEQIMGESQIASDVWAIGVIMYVLYTGLLPFYEENEKMLMDLILTKEPQRPREIEPDIPVELEKIILGCLKKNPRERFADAGALQKALLETFPDFGRKS